MKHVIVRHPPRADVELARALGEFGVATVHEAQGRTGLAQPSLRPLYPQARVAGTALTVLCQTGDNLMIHAALDVARSGDVLVVVTTSESTDGMFGELLAESCRAQGVVGLVIDAGVRDASELTAMNFPVWSKAVHAQGTVKATPGSVNVDVVCAGVPVRPGDVIVGDADGVVVVQRLAAAEVLAASEQRSAKERRTRDRLRAGELGLDIYALRAKLKEMGVEWIDAGDQTG
ncbi:MAG: 4-carboxy-4-hydroxy-2-oxoadipate aldolase/oxaloacetate decarboxylase [Vicinamibacterales bacterium]